MSDYLVFGSCAASQIALGLKVLQDSRKIPETLKIGYWAMPAEAYVADNFAEYGDKFVTVIRSHGNEKVERDIFDHQLDDKMEAWMYLPPRIQLPLCGKKNITYIYASIIFPFKNFIYIIRSLDAKWVHSYNMINDVILKTVEPQLKFLSFLKSTGVNLIVAEGPRLFEFDVDVKNYQHITNLYVSIIKKELRDLSIPVIEIDENTFLDNNGFTKQQFKLYPDDSLHANGDYGVLVAKNILNHL